MFDFDDLDEKDEAHVDFADAAPASESSPSKALAPLSPTEATAASTAEAPAPAATTTPEITAAGRDVPATGKLCSQDELPDAAQATQRPAAARRPARPVSESPEREFPRSASPGRLRPGLGVRLVKLQARPELNGRPGRLLAFDQTRNRWQVRTGVETILLKAANLEVEAGVTNETKGGSSAERRPLEKLSPKDAVEWVISAEHEFEALMLPLELEEDRGKIRKQYKHLSLLVHPDKNSHPDAGTAFRKLFGAMQTLSDPVEQRAALRRARVGTFDGGVGSFGGGHGDGAKQAWWEQATVDEMERVFKQMDTDLDKMGMFGTPGRGDDSQWVSPQDAHELYERDLTIVLDARDSSDFEVSCVLGAHSMPGHTMWQMMSLSVNDAFRLVLESPEQSVVVYSDNGTRMSRCGVVANFLQRHPKVDAARVRRLTGGLNAWKRLGLPVRGDPRPRFAGEVLGASMQPMAGPG